MEWPIVGTLEKMTVLYKGLEVYILNVYDLVSQQLQVRVIKHYQYILFVMLSFIHYHQTIYPSLSHIAFTPTGNTYLCTPGSLMHCSGISKVHVLGVDTNCHHCTQWLPSAWWRHQMETFFALLALCAGNSPVTVNSPHKGQWRGALMFSLIYAWINGWVNTREAGDLTSHGTHYNVIAMRARRSYGTTDCF